MAGTWPASGFAVWSYDSGIVNLPTSSTALPGTPGLGWIGGASFTNTTGNAINVTLTNTAGDYLVYSMEVAPTGEPIPLRDQTLRPANGLKWFASATGLRGQLWGHF